MDTQQELPARLARDLDGAFEALVRDHERLVGFDENRCLHDGGASVVVGKHISAVKSLTAEVAENAEENNSKALCVLSVLCG